MSAEEAFQSQLEYFRVEVNGASQMLYAYIGIYDAMSDKAVEDALNDHWLFWRTSLHALQLSTFIILNRIFDHGRDVKRSIWHLLRAAQQQPSIFSKESLAARKGAGATEKAAWIEDYVARAHVPAPADFRRLRQRVNSWARRYDRIYRPIRTEIFAHALSVTDDERERLWSATRIGELQRLLRFLRQLYDVLWELFHNGERPVLKPQRYSTRRMRLDPRDSSVHVQEWMTREVSEVMQKISGVKQTSQKHPQTDKA